LLPPGAGRVEPGAMFDNLAKATGRSWRDVLDEGKLDFIQ
jgi:hypothetical protein